jgi:CRP-like cAMP-binding protein
LSNRENHLIELLPRKDQRHLRKISERVHLMRSEVLGKVGEPTRHVYFPVDGFISLVASISGKPVLEVGMIGREGMFGAHVTLMVPNQPLHAVVQGAGSAWRIAIHPFNNEVARHNSLHGVLDRYLYVLMNELASSAACVRFHQTTARLGRWLLLMQDRAHSNCFEVTHEFLAYMLGVRRVSITVAAGELQRRGLIEYTRGRVTVLSRGGLKTAACSCYAAGQRSYARVMH